VPGKAAWLALEESAELEFEYYLASKLAVGTVAEMRGRMSNMEFLLWSRFYSRKWQAEELERLKAGG
jgi:hypothetical protein